MKANPKEAALSCDFLGCAQAACHNWMHDELGRDVVSWDISAKSGSQEEWVKRGKRVQRTFYELESTAVGIANHKHRERFNQMTPYGELGSETIFYLAIVALENF